jgi:tRNA(Ile2) C34 agmatinyltransferase TiaS
VTGATLVRAQSLFEPGGESTLDDVLVGVWEGLAAHRLVRCPVCGEQMEPQYSAGALPVGGRCRGCGTAVS